MTVESLHRRKDGSTFPVEINIAVVKLEKTYAVAIVRDVTEKKLAENKLKRSEEQLKEAQSVGLIGSWEWDIVKNTGTMSDEMYKIFNINSNSFDVTIETFLTTPIPEDRKMVQEIIMRSMKTHEATTFDFRTINPSGEIRWIHEKSTIEVDDKGNPKRVFGTSQDITERKLVELKLKESEIRARALLNANPDMIFRMNREGIYLDYKADRTELYAQSEVSIIGKKNRDITPPEFADMIDRYIGQTLDSGEIQEFEYQMITPKRGLRDYEARMVPSGKDEVVTVVRDITERKKLETNLSTAAEIAKLGYWEFDVKSGNFIFDDQYYRLIHGSSTEIQGGNIMGAEEFVRRFVHPDDSKMISNNLQEAITSTDPEYFGQAETRVFRDNGEIAYVMVQFKVLKDQFGNPHTVYGINQDITERKKAEETLKESEEQFRSVAQSANDAIVTADSEGIIKNWNQWRGKNIWLYGRRDNRQKPGYYNSTRLS